jgi:hypothetical protein
MATSTIRAPEDCAADDRAGVMSPDEAKALFDATARHYCGISGAEFLRRLDAREFAPDVVTQERVLRVAALIPLVRKTSARKKSR